MSFKKKKEINFKKDLFGRESDYSHYSLNRNEKNTGFLLGFGTAFISIYIFFHSIIASLLVGIVFGFLFLPFYQSFLLKKQSELLLLQFTDLLDSLSNSYSVGRNTMGAFKDSLNDLMHQHGNQAMIVVEVNLIILGLKNNFTIEKRRKLQGEHLPLAQIEFQGLKFAILTGARETCNLSTKECRPTSKLISDKLGFMVLDIINSRR